MEVSDVILTMISWSIAWFGYGGAVGLVIGAFLFGQVRALAVALPLAAATFVVLSVMP